MKKLIALCLLLFPLTGLRAQENASVTKETGVRLGLKVNPLLAWLRTSTDNPDVATAENTGTRFGGSFGIIADFFFTPNYGLSSELRLAYIGSRFKYTVMESQNVSKSYEPRMALQYLELPIALKLRTNEIGYAKYYGRFGVIPAIRLSAKGSQVNVFTNPSQNTTETLENRKFNVNTNPVTVSLLVGGGMEYSLGGNASVLAGVSWCNGFTNIWQSGDTDSPISKLDTKLTYIALDLGVLF